MHATDKSRRMAKFQNKYRVEPNRFQFWDYSAPGKYFLTHCVADRECIFGEIINKEIVLSEFGIIVRDEILKLPEYHPRVILDEWIVMPNHIHLIVELCGYDFNNSVADVDGGFTGANDNRFHHTPADHIERYRKSRRQMIIPKISGKFKMITSKQINIIRNTPGRKTWQRDYYDHVIRNEKSYWRIKYYIRNNPKNWGRDSLRR